MIKKLSFLFIWFVITSAFIKAQTFWERIAFNDTSVTTLSINSKGNIIAGLNYHSLYYSDDDGGKWIKITTPDIFLSFTCIDDSGIIYVVDTDAFDNSLQRTSDLGQNWTVISDSGTIGCYSFGVKSTVEIFATFSFLINPSNYIYHSFDGGSSWEKDSIGFNVSLLNNLNTQSVYTFGTGDTVYVIGTDGIYRSADNGRTWAKKNNGLSASHVTTLCKNNFGHLFTQGNFIVTVGGLYRSRDNAESWEAVAAVGLPQFYDFYQLITDSNNFLYGISNDVYKSTDEGDNWTNISNGLPGSSNNILAVSPNGIIFCGTHFGLYKSTNTLTSLKNDSNNPNDFSLQQNYPNPFNPSTKIRFVIPNGVRNLKDFSSQAPRNDNSLVTLKVYDVLGNEVATLVNEEKTAGTYEVTFSAKGGSASGGDAYSLTSGLYFYTLTAGGHSQTKKMILIK